MDKTKVTSTHILQRHNILRHLDVGGRVQLRSGFGGIRQRFNASLSTEGGMAGNPKPKLWARSGRCVNK